MKTVRPLLAFLLVDAVFAMELTQAHKAAYNSQQHTVPTYNVGDEIFLGQKFFTPATSAILLSKKLGLKQYVPFNIVRLIEKGSTSCSTADH